MNNLSGQINLNTKLGQLIYNLVINNQFKNIVDIGTWNGLGTTYCVLKALEDKQDINAQIYTIELYPDMYKIAQDNLSSHNHKNLTMLLGTIIDFNDVYWFDHSSLDLTKDVHAKLWYKKDMELLKNSINVLNQLPEKIDLLILDGGEYTTYPEWQKLKNRIKFFVLDDTNILKCSKIKQEILSSVDYTIIHDITNDRNGYIIGFKNDL